MTHAPDFRARYGPWAIVAGASDGLGAEFATQLAERGLNLVLVARRAQKLAERAAHLAQAYSIEVRPLSFDLARPETISAIAAHTQDIEIGILVYNAALSVIGPFLERSLEDHVQEIEVNCRAPMALAHTMGRRLAARKRGGIILMSSLSASQGSALVSNYAATKAYNLLLAEGLWEELRQKGVDVLACRAGATSTPNYLASLSHHSSQVSVPALAPGAVVSETLAALGKQPSLIPGRMNRLAAFLMSRLLPRTVAIRLMGRVLRNMYPQRAE